MELTKEKAIEFHRKMWNWIADTIETLKCIVDIHALKVKFCAEDYVINECFCCDYSYNKSCFNTCEKCPIDWESEVKEFMCQDKYITNDYKGLYWICCKAESWQQQAALARKIAELPERKNT